MKFALKLFSYIIEIQLNGHYLNKHLLYMENQKIIKKYEARPDIIMQFLALFNQIDKHFDKIILSDWYLPYNEKIKRIVEWYYHISWFVKIHQFQLKYFGEIRNQITHGIQLDWHTYVYPTEYAIKELSKYADIIKRPPRCINVFGKPVFTCNKNDKLQKIVSIMEEKDYSHVPVYDDEKNYMWILSESKILAWLTTGEDKIIKETKVIDVNLITDKNYTLFINKSVNVYEIDQIFTKKKQNNEKIWAVLITENGKKNEPLLGIITAGDTALVDTYVIH